MVREGMLQGPGCASTKVAGERDEPSKSLLRSLTKTLQGTHDSKRDGHPDGNDWCDSWTDDPRQPLKGNASTPFGSAKVVSAAPFDPVLHARSVGSRNERDAPAHAGQPHTHRPPSGPGPEERDGAVVRRAVADRGERLERHRDPVRTPDVRRAATITRPGCTRPRGRGGRGEVMPMDAAMQDGPTP
jgi:hypothetical protein